MGSSFSIRISKDKKEIDRYYDHYLNRVGSYLNATSKKDYLPYKKALEKSDNDEQVIVSEQLLTSVVEEMNVLPEEIYQKHSDAPWTLSSEIGLAALIREFERTRQRLLEQDKHTMDDNELYYNRAIEGYIALLDFAVQHGYAVSYP